MESDDRVATYGAATKGYQWQTLFLPNGTLLKITYKGRDHLAEIRHEHLTHDGRKYTPSEWASWVANNTSRNAWRDISVQLPGSSRWELADVLRHKREGEVVVRSFQMTAHATTRMQQRGHRPADIEFVLKHGTDTRDGILLTEKDARRIEAYARREISQAMRLRGTLVPCANCAIKTVFRSTRRQQRRLL